MENLLQILNSIFPLSAELTEYLTCTLQAKEVKRKEYLLKAGHVCRHIYFIEKGLLRCFYVQAQHEVSSWFMKEGDVVIAVESFFDQRQSNEFIQALEDTSLYYISFDHLRYIYRTFLEFNFVGRELVQKYYKLSEQRLYSLRMHRGLERFDLLKKDHPE